MKHIIILAWLVAALPNALLGQKKLIKEGTATFYSSAPLEDIEAHNNKISSILDMSNGNIAFSIAISGFVFEKALMQEHFNEKYLESHLFPTATFSGTLQQFDADNPSRTTSAKGKLTIHGVTKKVEVPGTVVVTDGILIINASFFVDLEDYKIKKPKMLWQNIADSIKVTINAQYEIH